MQRFLRFLFVLLVFVPISIAQADFGPPPPPPPGGGGPLPPGGGSGGGSPAAASGGSHSPSISNGTIAAATAACLAAEATLDDDVKDVGTFVRYGVVPCVGGGTVVYIAVNGGMGASALVGGGLGVVSFLVLRHWTDIFPPHPTFRQSTSGGRDDVFRCRAGAKNRDRNCRVVVPESAR